MSSPNDKRAMRCDAIISGYGDDEFATNLVDLLADAMHWCDSAGEDFHYMLAQSGRHYINELNDEQHDERRMIP